MWTLVVALTDTWATHHSTRMGAMRVITDHYFALSEASACHIFVMTQLRAWVSAVQVSSTLGKTLWMRVLVLAVFGAGNFAFVAARERSTAPDIAPE